MMLIDIGSGGDGSTEIILSCVQCISFLLFAFNINLLNGHWCWLAVIFFCMLNLYHYFVCLFVLFTTSQSSLASSQMLFYVLENHSLSVLGSIFPLIIVL